MEIRTDTAFRVRDARRAGLSRRAVDDGCYERPFTGLRVRRGEPIALGPFTDPAADMLRRAATDFTAHMRSEEFFSHLTAAALWGLPLPFHPGERIDVSVLAPGRAARGRGVRGHQLDPRQVDVVDHPVTRFAVTSPVSTWAQLGGVVRHPYDLTAMADALLRIPRLPGPNGGVLGPALAMPADLIAESERGRRIGIAGLRESRERARAGASSRPETWTRLTICDAGLPEPILDHDVYDGDGRFVGCVDLAYPELKVAIEYEGDHHRTTPQQWYRDIEKYDRLAELGWRVIRVTRAMLFESPGMLVARVRAALRAHG